jgi:uncharacterized glyoxalase superfamily protein PhnB
LRTLGGGGAGRGADYRNGEEEMTLTVTRVVPILRIYDERKAREFYVDWLGFAVDWEHRYDANAPLFMQISRAGILLHLSEHYGDGTPGSQLSVHMTGLDELHAELIGKAYRYMRPGIEEMPWNARVMRVIDPFGNRIHFTQFHDRPA